MKRLKYHTLIIAIALCSVISNLQAQTTQSETFMLNGRERDSTWFRYNSGVSTIIAMPVFGLYYNNLDPNQTYYTVQYGLRLGYGHFVAKNLMLGSTFEFNFCNMEQGRTINTQNLAIYANYYFLPNKRFSPLISFNPSIERYNYLPSHKSILDDRDPINGNRKTHFFPQIALMPGVSLKIKKHLTLQFSAAARYIFKEIYSEGEKVSPVSPDFRLNLMYHF